MFERLRLFRFPPALFLILIFLIFGLAGCRTATDITLEDARKITAVGTDGIAPPPRAGLSNRLYNPEYLELVNKPCKDEPPVPVDIDRVIDDIALGCQRGGHGAGSQYCLSDTLFARGRDAMNHGQYVEAIALIKEAIAKDQGASAERYRPHLATSYAAIGDFSAARWAMGGGNTSLFRSQSGRYQAEANYAIGRASLARLKGDYREAEVHYRKAQKLCKRGTYITANYNVFLDTEFQMLPDFAEVLLMQGRPVEAELMLRDMLIYFVHWSGSSSTGHIRASMMLGRVFFEQGRYAEAETMTRAAIGRSRIYGTLCSQLDLNIAHHNLARVLLARERAAEALEQFDLIRRNMRHTPEIFKLRFANDPDWAYALLANGEFKQAEEKLGNALKAARDQYGDDHPKTAEIRGLLAVAQHRQSKTKAAEKNFADSLPTLLKYSRESEQEAAARVAFNRRLGRIAEAYLDYMATTQKDRAAAARTTFRIADSLRGTSVQQAVIASGTRIAAKDRRLADLVRREQDAGKKITALNTVLLNSMSQSDGGSGQTETLKKEIAQLRQARLVILDEIEENFPNYAEITRPRPKKMTEIQAALKPDEALLAYYLGKDNAFVWSVSGKGLSGFARLPLNSVDISQKVDAIRQSLTPKGLELSDLPRFDLRAARQLYQGLLEPVKETWKDAGHLIIVPHGSLGHLPFSLLVGPKRISKSIGHVQLAGYRKVPWLIRDHSITVLPSAGSLLTLRQLPIPDPNRRAFAGFGDPVFNQQQAAILAANKLSLHKISTRAIRITKEASLDEGQLTSATLEMLQPLPDTREEVLSIARALKADMAQDVYLGQAASELIIKKTDLSDRRVLVFATHGLVPGDLNGLRQPALALSSPTVTGDTNNDGILTMGEIMGLRLNADWVVLSACNTAAGEGAGSEAVSGLGQAFFYAGTRALLVSNWPVESASAKLLTTELFRQQEADPTLSRAVALQKSMLKLLDTGVYRDPKTNQAVYAYAHPMFWAPFVLVGEGSK